MSNRALTAAEKQLLDSVVSGKIDLNEARKTKEFVAVARALSTPETLNLSNLYFLAGRDLSRLWRGLTGEALLKAARPYKRASVVLMANNVIDGQTTVHFAEVHPTVEDVTEGFATACSTLGFMPGKVGVLVHPMWSDGAKMVDIVSQHIDLSDYTKRPGYPEWHRQPASTRRPN